MLGTVGAIGAAIAAALPPSRREDELLGDTSDDLRRRAWAAGREGYVQAKSAAAAAYAAAEHEAREQGLSGEGVESVAETVRHKVETVAQAATEAAKQKAGFGEQEPAPNQDASRYGQAGFQDRGDGEPTRQASQRRSRPRRPQGRASEREPAAESGRIAVARPIGRARSPPGWRDVLWRVWEQIGKDNVSMIAAGVAFYSLLAIFPAITAFVSLYGLVADPAEVEQRLQLLGQVIPNDALGLIGDQLRSVASAGGGRLGLSAVSAILLALWSAGAGVRSLMTALNISYQEDEKRSFVRFTWWRSPSRSA